MKKSYNIFVSSIVFLLCLNVVNAGILEDLYSFIIGIQSTTTTPYDDYLNVNDNSESIYINNAQDDVKTLFSPTFYTINYQTNFLTYGKIAKVNDTKYKVSFGVDLNNIHIVQNRNDDSETYRSFSYFYNNYIRSSTADLTKIAQTTTSSTDVNDNDYFGLPMYIKSCYVDCDTNDNIQPTTYNSRDFTSGDIWFMYINSYSGASSDWINSRFPSDNQFYEKNRLIRFFKDSYTCNYDTLNVKKIAYGCIIEKNPSYRDDNKEDSVWSFRDINSNFNITNPSQNTMVISGSYEIDLSTSQFSHGTDALTETNVTNSQSPSKGDNNALSIERQRDLLLTKQINDKNVAWQKVLLNISSFIFGAVVISFYLISLIVMVFLVILAIPYITNKIKINIEKMMRW